MDSWGRSCAPCLGAARRCQVAGRRMGPIPELKGFRLVTLMALFFLFVVITNGEVVRWRRPGASGRWTDPHNWIGQTSGVARIPGPNDDVVIGDGWSVLYGARSQVTLEVRNGPVYIRSLTIGTSSSTCAHSCSVPLTNWNYNSTQWRPYTYAFNGANWPLPEKCSATLIIKAPTRLIVAQTFDLLLPSSLQLVGAPGDPHAQSTVIAQTITLGSTTLGCGNLEAQEVIFQFNPTKVNLVTMSDAYTRSTVRPFGCTMHIKGKLTVRFAVRVYFYVDIPNNDTSHVTVDGVLDWFSPTCGVMLDQQGGTTLTANDSLSFFSFTSGLNLPSPSTILGDNNAIQDGDLYSVTCATDPGGFDTTLCPQHTTTDLSVVLLSGVTCCPPGRTGQACVADCPGSPDCNTRGNCIDSSVPFCDCLDGWTGSACQIPDCPGTPDCNDRGTCIVPAGSSTPVCQCDEGWNSTADCSVPLCANNCTDESHGTCFTAGDKPQCVCKKGWQLGPSLDCSVAAPSCPGLGELCSGHGICSANGTCLCGDDWQGADCSLAICQGACNNRGKCVSNDWNNGTKCNCSTGWTGTQCETADCGSSCSGHGYCNGDLDPPRCICDEPITFQASQPTQVAPYSGWSGSDCSVPSIPYCPASQCEENGGTCSNEITTGSDCLVNSCPAGRSGWDCSKLHCSNTGIPECSGHGQCTLVGGEARCVCRDGYTLGPDGDCRQATCEVFGCNGRGKCRTDLAVPMCECEPHFYGSDCSIGGCDSDADCSGVEQGQCVNGSCVCTDDWQGDDCSVVRCPFWQGEQCNLKGDCNATTIPHECVCEQGWEGTACETPVCPGNCSDHGDCDSTRDPPQCFCDDGWQGDDCSQESSDGDNDEDILIGVLTGGLIGLALIAVLIGSAVALFIAYRHRKKLKARLRSMNNLIEMQRLASQKPAFEG